MSAPPPRDPLCLVLWGLTALFAFRVAAQPLELFIPELPAFDAWHGSVMPYPILLASQLTILALMIAVNLACMRGRLVPQPRLAQTLTVLGAVYFSTILARPVPGQTLDQPPAWFDRPLPAAFHLVLAGWLLLVGRRLSRRAN